MADFKRVLEAAHAGYSNREDYPPFALVSWDDRPRWNAYLEKINSELNAELDAEVVIDAAADETGANS